MTYPYRPAYTRSRSPTLTRHSFSAGQEVPNRIGIGFRNPAPLDTVHADTVDVDIIDWDMFDKDLDDFFSRTVRAYVLVRSYWRDCVGGTRWTRDDIEYIRKTGLNLPHHVLTLRRRQSEYGQCKKEDDSEVKSIRKETKQVQRYCEEIMNLITDLERIPLRQRMSRGNVQRTEEYWKNHGPDGRKVSTTRRGRSIELLVYIPGEFL